MAGDIPLDQLQPSQVLEPCNYDAYEKHHRAIWNQLVRLNSNLFILDKLLGFPASLFLGPERTVFFRLVEASLVESSVLIISKLAQDDDLDTLTMPRFKNWLRRSIRGEYVHA